MQDPEQLTTAVTTINLFGSRSCRVNKNTLEGAALRAFQFIISISYFGFGLPLMPAFQASGLALKVRPEIDLDHIGSGHKTSPSGAGRAPENAVIIFPVRVTDPARIPVALPGRTTFMTSMRIRLAVVPVLRIGHRAAVGAFKNFLRGSVGTAFSHFPVSIVFSHHIIPVDGRLYRLDDP